MKLGSILPTKESVKCNVDFAARNTMEKKKAAYRAGLYGGRIQGGELRYYETPAIYAIIGRNMAPRWFEVTSHGDYPTKDPRAAQ